MNKSLFNPSEHMHKREHTEYHETVRTADWLKGEIHNGKNIIRTHRPFPSLVFTHFPAEGAHGKEGYFAKRMGVLDGVPDFIFFWPDAQTGFIEMKAPGKNLSHNQITFRYNIKAISFPYHAVCYTAEQVRDTLISWGVPYTSGIPIPPRKLTHTEQLAAQYEWSRPSE